MAKRPQISDDLHEVVHTIHEEYTGKRANGFESALETVTQLAEAQILEKENTDPGWYPGKYMSEVVSRLSARDSNTERSSSIPSTNEPSVNLGQPVNLGTQAVFKTRLGDESDITIPEPEVEALNLSHGDVLQVIAYSIQNE